jgi:hypothetical protein
MNSRSHGIAAAPSPAAQSKGRSTMNHLVSLVVTGLIALGTTGCLTSPVSISPSSIPLERGTYTVVQEEVSGEAFGVYILGFPVSEPRQMATARDRAIESAGADALIDITTDYTVVNLLLAQVTWTTVNGDAVQLNE